MAPSRSVRREMEVDLHLQGTLGSQVGLEDLLEALGGVDVDTEGGSLAHHIGLGVDELKRSHSLSIPCFSS